MTSATGKIKAQTWPKERSCGDKRLDHRGNLLMAYRGIERAIHDLEAAHRHEPCADDLRDLRVVLGRIEAAYARQGGPS